METTTRWYVAGWFRTTTTTTTTTEHQALGGFLKLVVDKHQLLVLLSRMTKSNQRNLMFLLKCCSTVAWSCNEVRTKHHQSVWLVGLAHTRPQTPTRTNQIELVYVRQSWAASSGIRYALSCCQLLQNLTWLTWEFPLSAHCCSPDLSFQWTSSCCTSAEWLKLKFTGIEINLNDQFLVDNNNNNNKSWFLFYCSVKSVCVWEKKEGSQPEEYPYISLECLPFKLYLLCVTLDSLPSKQAVEVEMPTLNVDQYNSIQCRYNRANFGLAEFSSSLSMST